MGGGNWVVFVIRPDSAASEVCGEEVNHGINWKKRIVPILYREGDYKTLNAAISSHNWIYFRDTDSFDEAFKSLLQTLDTDLDYVHAHTRLLVRAREWDSKQRNPSFCLRGADLLAAEKWLTESADKKPRPTLLHNEYIAASRRLASSQQRILIAAMGLGLIAAIILAILALTQWQVAQANGATAIANANTAEFAKNEAQVNAQTAVAAKNEAQLNYAQAQRLQLASSANRILQADDGNAEVAALLSIQSLKSGYLPHADASLGQPVDRLYTQHVLIEHTAVVVNSVAISNDGRYALTGSNDKNAWLWDLATGHEVRKFSGHKDNVTSVAFSTDGSYIVTGSIDGTAIVWDAKTGEQVTQLIGSTEPVWDVAFSPDDTYVAVGVADGSVVLWDYNKNVLAQEFDAHKDAVWSVAFSSDSKYLVTGGNDQTARLWNVETGAQVREYGGTIGVVYSAVLSPNGKLLATAGSDKAIHLWDVDTG